MKKIISLLTVILLCSNLNAMEKLKIGTGEWLPLTSKTMENKGIASEILVSAFREEGIEVELQFLPWKRCEHFLDQGKLDAIFPYGKNDERLRKYDYSEGFIMVRTVFFYLKNNIPELEFEKYSDLKKYKIIGQLGYWYEETLSNEGVSVDYVNSDEQIIDMVKRKRVDLGILTDIGGWFIINKDFPEFREEFKTTYYDLKPGNVKKEEMVSSLIVTKSNKQGKEILEKFNKGLQKIKDNGIYNQIMEKYNLKFDM